MKKQVLIFAIIGIGLMFILFLKFGKPFIQTTLSQIIHPKETVQSTVEKLETNALERLSPRLQALGIPELPDKILLLGLKEEQLLQVYYLSEEGNYQLLKEYPFTAFSGELGPKLKEGDRQIPEGIYKIEYLNPNSSYHLSMKVSYPNEFDKEKSTLSTVSEMGGDIFIHGKAVTIGCIPIGDEAIEELFLLASHAIDNDIKVIISPRDFRVNPAEPSIEGIDWEKELYAIIKAELNQLPLE